MSSSSHQCRSRSLPPQFNQQAIQTHSWKRVVWKLLKKSFNLPSLPHPISSLRKMLSTSHQGPLLLLTQCRTISKGCKILQISSTNNRTIKISEEINSWISQTIIWPCRWSNLWASNKTDSLLSSSHLGNNSHSRDSLTTSHLTCLWDVRDKEWCHRQTTCHHQATCLRLVTCHHRIRCHKLNLSHHLNQTPFRTWNRKLLLSNHQRSSEINFKFQRPIEYNHRP